MSHDSLDATASQQDLQSVEQLLRQILVKLDQLECAAPGPRVDDRRRFFSTLEAAELLGRAPFTVRAWCRNGRVNAVKREVGRGAHREWLIAADEVARIRDEGLTESAAAGSSLVMPIIPVAQGCSLRRDAWE